MLDLLRDGHRESPRLPFRPTHAILGLALAFAGSCGGDGPTTPPAEPAEIVVVSGDQQVGKAGTLLGQVLAVRVVDREGRPVVGATVTWSGTGGGWANPPTSVTDRDGRAFTLWTLGPDAGPESVAATVERIPPAQFALSATAESNHPPPPGAPVPLVLATYDGSRQVVHPDFVRIPGGLENFDERLALTPYPFGNASFEVPSVFAGHVEDDWQVQPGAPNPVIPPSGADYSDPDILYDPDARELRLYYRSVARGNEVFLTRSRNGISWSPPVEVARASAHDIVSPAIVRRSAGEWLMWSVRAGVGCDATETSVELRRSTNGVSWSAPIPVSLVQPGYSVWHIDVSWIPALQQYWALYAVKTAGGCLTPAVYLAVSTDGVHWSVFPSPVLSRGAIPELQDVVYRSTFEYDPSSDMVTFWYSGARYQAGRYVWRAAVQRRDRHELFTSLAQPPAGQLAGASRPDLPPLVDWP